MIFIQFFPTTTTRAEISIKLLVIYDLNYTNGTKSLINIVNFEKTKKQIVAVYDKTNENCEHEN